MNEHKLGRSGKCFFCKEPVESHFNIPCCQRQVQWMRMELPTFCTCKTNPNAPCRNVAEFVLKDLPHIFLCDRHKRVLRAKWGKSNHTGLMKLPKTVKV